MIIGLFFCRPKVRIGRDFGEGICRKYDFKPIGEFSSHFGWNRLCGPVSGVRCPVKK
jgi:hypothetical protein